MPPPQFPRLVALPESTLFPGVRGHAIAAVHRSRGFANVFSQVETPRYRVAPARSFICMGMVRMVYNGNCYRKKSRLKNMERLLCAFCWTRCVSQFTTDSIHRSFNTNLNIQIYFFSLMYPFFTLKWLGNLFSSFLKYILCLFAYYYLI